MKWLAQSHTAEMGSDCRSPDSQSIRSTAFELAQLVLVRNWLSILRTVAHLLSQCSQLFICVVFLMSNIVLNYKNHNVFALMYIL